MIKCIQSFKSDNRLQSQATSEGGDIESNLQIAQLVNTQVNINMDLQKSGNLYMFIIIQIQASQSVLLLFLPCLAFVVYVSIPLSINFHGWSGECLKWEVETYYTEMLHCVFSNVSPFVWGFLAIRTAMPLDTECPDKMSSDSSSGSEDSSRTSLQLAPVRPSKGKAKKTGGDKRSRSKNDKRLRTKDVFESDGSSAYQDPHSTSSQAPTMRYRKGAATAAEAHRATLHAPIHPTEQSLLQDEGTGSDMKVSDTSRVTNCECVCSAVCVCVCVCV